MAEAGVPNFEISSWNALYAPARAPEAALQVIRQATTEILSQDDVKAKFREIGFVAKALPPGVQDELMRSEIERWAKVIAELGIERREIDRSGAFEEGGPVSPIDKRKRLQNSSKYRPAPLPPMSSIRFPCASPRI